jgi:BirA family biotin operon repressor/biotin-[acetyl-CoA-carboxylase] ligase
MKDQILTLLRDKNDVVSGEGLSARLGVSRVTVWKHIQKLRACGYEIQSTPRGYLLKSSPDTPFPWEFPQRMDGIHYVERTASTMDIARDLARKGAPGFSVVVADIQEKGRGRLKRVWQSPAGGLYFTMVVRPDLPPLLSPRINFAASLILAQVVERVCNIEVRVKWPNDLLTGGKKIAGMLSEMEAEGDLVSFINIGIGVNVNNDPPSDVDNAASIRQLTGTFHSRIEILSRFLDQFEERMSMGSLDSIMAEWKQQAATIGKKVIVETTRGTTRGTALDVDENGALILETETGERRTVIYGDCFHQSE